MPTALSSTDLPYVLSDEWRAVRDVGHLLRFRAGTVRRRALIAVGVLGGLTVIAGVAPAGVHGAGLPGHAHDVLTLLPAGFAAFQILTIVSGIASGGGRELVAREQLVAYPVSPTTDHLGALLLAPLNTAWLMESWLLLGMGAYAVGWSPRLLPMAVGVLLWVAASTAIGQVIAWVVEAVRRTTHGPWIVRALLVAVVGLVVVLQAARRLRPVLDALPTHRFVTHLADGGPLAVIAVVVALVGLLVAAVVVGVVPAHLAERLVPRDELRAGSGTHRSRTLPRSDRAMLLRLDRASVWRTVPMRRGIAVLALAPGAAALIGGLPWSQLTVFPGLVASGGALLFGVNAWCLDERGGLWRESLPVAPGLVFAARVQVLAEFLLLASAATTVVGSLRAGRPTAADVTSMLATWVVVSALVVSSAMRWSQRSPYSVDLRSARATPAPPMAMVGYSARLAVGTTIVALVFQGLGHAGWWVPVVVGLVALAWPAWQLGRLRAQWEDPVVRARVVTTVAL